MEVRIFTPTLAFSGICDRVRTLEARECFDEAGDFSCTVPFAEAEKFTPGGHLWIPGTADGFVIRSVREEPDTDTARVSGRSVLSYLEKRAVPARQTMVGDASSLVTQLALTYGGTVLPCLMNATAIPTGLWVHSVAGGSSLLDAMKKIARTEGLGLRLSWLPGERNFHFRVRRPATGPVFLSRSLGNLRAAVRVRSIDGYINRVYVEGADGERLIVNAAGLFSDGIDDASMLLSEKLVRAAELSLAQFEDADEYEEALRSFGKLVLAQHRPVTTVSVDTDDATAARLTPGDLCPFTDTVLGIQSTALCREKSVKWNADGTVRCAVKLAVWESGGNTEGS